MTVEQIIAGIAGLTALLVATAAVLREIGELRRQIDGRLTELLMLTASSARGEGEAMGRRQARAETASDLDASKSIHNAP